MLFDLFVVQYVTLTLFCLSVMVSTVPAYLQNILIGTATRGNDQEWTNQNPYIEEEQTTQWQKEKVQKDKQ
jgi:hypothetical protein